MSDAATQRREAPLRPESETEKALVRAARQEAKYDAKVAEARAARDAAILTLLRTGVRPARVAKLCGKTRGLMTRYVRQVEQENAARGQ